MKFISFLIFILACLYVAAPVAFVETVRLLGARGCLASWRKG